jgi:ABC-type Fe3+/spermidine/putrescine transport system ATPase subunit
MEHAKLMDAVGVGLRIEGARHCFGETWALRGVTLSVAPGEFLTLLGPSGSGKTTLLRIVAGLLQPTSGAVFVGDRDVSILPPREREMGFVFQNYALFPHLTTFENVAFPLELRGVDPKETRQRVLDILHMVELAGFENRYPNQLSGGQQQRVALARAVVFRPSVLLMDEPLGSLDRQLRERMQIEIRRLQRELGITTIYVTHDQQEAFSMSDTIVIMRDGEILQIGRPREIYQYPIDPFTASFVGYLNAFEGELIPSSDTFGFVLTKQNMKIPINLENISNKADEIFCGVRPEKIILGAEVHTDVRFKGKIGVLTFQGTFYWAEVDLPSGRRLLVQLPEQELLLREGDEIFVGWNNIDTIVF